MDQNTPKNESLGVPLGSKAFELENLVMEDVLSTNIDWLKTLAPKKVFYLRGYSWFQANVGDLTLITNQDEQKSLVEAMHEIVKGREQWNAQNVVANAFSFREQVV